jgi:hypothetical protein
MISPGDDLGSGQFDARKELHRRRPVAAVASSSCSLVACSASRTPLRTKMFAPGLTE